MTSNLCLQRFFKCQFENTAHLWQQVRAWTGPSPTVGPKHIFLPPVSRNIQISSLMRSSGTGSCAWMLWPSPPPPKKKKINFNFKLVGPASESTTWWLSILNDHTLGFFGYVLEPLVLESIAMRHNCSGPPRRHHSTHRIASRAILIPSPVINYNRFTPNII